MRKRCKLLYTRLRVKGQVYALFALSANFEIIPVVLQYFNGLRRDLRGGFSRVRVYADVGSFFANSLPMS